MFFAADVGIGPIQISPAKELVVDFTRPWYHAVGWSVLLRKETAKRNLYTFFQVMDRFLWALVLFSFGIILFLMYFTNVMSPYAFRNNMVEMAYDTDVKFFDVREISYYGFQTVTGQGTGPSPKGKGAK